MCSLSQEFAGCHPTTIGVDDYQNFGSNLYVYRGTSFFVSYLVRMLLYICLVTGMGKRKLRFDARKNFECKKYRKITVSVPLEVVSVNTDDAEESELIVSLPLAAYTSATLPDATVLHSRKSRSNALPAGWTLACLPASTSYLVTFALASSRFFHHFVVLMLPSC